MQLIKIGGAVFNNFDGFSKLLEIIELHSKKPLIVVISAFSNATHILKEAAQTAELGKLNKAKSIINKLISEHRALATKLIKEKDVLDSLFYMLENSDNKICELLKAISITTELTPKTLDNIMSYGEFFALHTIYHYLLENNFNIHSVDSTQLIVSDDSFGNAKPILDLTTKAIKTKLKPLLKKNNIILTQGFVAKNRIGEITTMGIESSNLTAVLLSQVLGFKEITFWTDVEGIRTADPKLVNKTLSLSKISYDLAHTLSVNGLKLVYPEMIEYAERKKIKLIYKSAFKPFGEFTIIDKAKNILKHPIIMARKNLFFDEFYFKNENEKNILKAYLSELKSKNEVLSFKFLENSAVVISKSNQIFLPKLISKFSNYRNLQVCQINIFSDIPIDNLNEITALLKQYRNYILELYISSKSIKILITDDKMKNLINQIHKKIIKKN